jgi:cell pole-organizing protein PopZ
MINSDRDDDMSIEDILASIRKYVTDPGSPSVPQDKEETSQQDDNSGNLGHDENVISLDKSQIAEEKEGGEELSIDAALYAESTPASGVTVSPFGKLTNALKSYGKPKEQNVRPESPTIDKFLEEVAKPIIEKWVEGNLEQIVEKIVEREIERIKNEN